VETGLGAAVGAGVGVGVAVGVAVGVGVGVGEGEAIVAFAADVLGDGPVPGDPLDAAIATTMIRRIPAPAVTPALAGRGQLERHIL
jgi:hypothetical protein